MRAIFGQPDNSIDFREAMDAGKIIIVTLPDRIGRDDASFIGAYLIWDIARAMFSRADREKRRRFHILADEFPRFMTTTFARVQDEGSKFGVDVVIAHQNRDQIDDVKIKGSTLAVGNKIVLRVSGKDGGELAPEFRLTIPEGEVHERPKHALVANVLEYLSTGRHEDRHVIAVYEKLRAHLDELYARILNAARVAAVQLRLKLVQGKRTSERAFDRAEYNKLKEQFELSKQELERTINRILFFMMSAESDDQIGLWSHISPEPQDTLADTLDALYGISNLDSQWFNSNHLGYISQVQKLRAWRRERGTVGDDFNNQLRQHHAGGGYPALWEYAASEQARCRKEYPVTQTQQPEGDVVSTRLTQKAPSPETVKLRWQTAYSLDEGEMQLRTLVFVLGQLLYQNPCFAPVGQLEQVRDRERVYSDVANEMANTLSNLPQFIALCTIVQERKPAQYLLETIEPPTVEKKDLGEEIREASRQRYGRDRQQIEAAIRRRLGEEGPEDEGERYTTPHQKPSPIAPPSEYKPKKEDPYNDDGPI